MKKIVFGLLLASAVFACNKIEKAEQKEEKLEEKLEGPDAPIDGNDIEDLDSFRDKVNTDIKKGDSIVIATLRKEIDQLREEVAALKAKK